MQKRSQPGLVKLGHLPQAKSTAKRRFFILGLVLEEETSAVGDEQHPGARQTLSPHPQGDIGVTEDMQSCEAPHELANRRRESSTKRGFPASHVFPEEIPGLLQQVPLRSCSSLNKYRVLPSIGCRGAGSGAVEAVAEQIDQLKVSSGHGDAPTIKTLSGEQESAGVTSEIDGPDEEGSHVQRPLANPGRKMRQVNPSMSALSLEEPPKKESCLLLAIRSPSGQRFEHHFKPTDSLQTVLAVAEQKTAAKYKRCSVETMEVPRRSFSDLTRSLHDCGILHKSVLCIQQKEQHDTDL
ncbi:Ubxn10 [Columba livia]|nr:Ubxn10 [Columba livia]